MAKKKTNSKSKKNAQKVKKDIDIKDIDAMIDDMKQLALANPEEEVKETKSEVVVNEDVKQEEIVEYLNESKDNVVISSEENVIFTNKEEMESFTGPLVKAEFDEDGNLTNEEDIKAIAQGEEPKEEEVIEDLEKLQQEAEEDEMKIDDDDEEKKPKSENKPKRKTYEEMFGNTWMGYGYSMN